MNKVRRALLAVLILSFTTYALPARNTATANDVACGNNTSGTRPQDCGLPAQTNMLSNGWFQLDGPNEGAAYPIPNNSFLPLMEGWDVHYSGPGTGVTAQRVTADTPSNAGFAAEIVVRSGGASNAGDHFTFEHKIRADAMGVLGWGNATARPVTLAFSAQCSQPGTYAVALVQDLPVPGGRSYVHPYALPDTAWHDFVFTIPGDTTGGWPAVGTGWTLEVDFVLDAGANFQTATTGAWQNGEYLTTPGQTRLAAVSGTCRFGKARLVNAPAPVDDALPSIDTEIAVNMADYFKTYARGVPVGAAGAAGGASGPIAALGATASVGVKDTTITNLGGAGIRATTTAGAVVVSADHVNVSRVGTNGVEVSTGGVATVSNSVSFVNAAGVAATAAGAVLAERFQDSAKVVVLAFVILAALQLIVIALVIVSAP